MHLSVYLSIVITITPFTPATGDRESPAQITTDPIQSNPIPSHPNSPFLHSTDGIKIQAQKPSSNSLYKAPAHLPFPYTHSIQSHSISCHAIPYHIHAHAIQSLITTGSRKIKSVYLITFPISFIFLFFFYSVPFCSVPSCSIDIMIFYKSGSREEMR